MQCNARLKYDGIAELGERCILEIGHKGRCEFKKQKEMSE